MTPSAVGTIWLGRQLEQKQAQKARAAISFLLFNLNFMYIKNAGGEDFNQFLMDIPSFPLCNFLSRNK